MGNCLHNYIFTGIMVIVGIPAQTETDNVPTYVSNKVEQFFAYYTIMHVTDIPCSPTGQAVIERSNKKGE